MSVEFRLGNKEVKFPLLSLCLQQKVENYRMIHYMYNMDIQKFPGGSRPQFILWTEQAGGAGGAQVVAREETETYIPRIT